MVGMVGLLWPVILLILARIFKSNFCFKGQALEDYRVKRKQSLISLSHAKGFYEFLFRFWRQSKSSLDFRLQILVNDSDIKPLQKIKLKILNTGIGYGFTKSFGVFMPYIREQFNVDNTTTSLIWAMMMFFQYSGSLIGIQGTNIIV